MGISPLKLRAEDWLTVTFGAGIDCSGWLNVGGTLLAACCRLAGGGATILLEGGGCGVFALPGVLGPSLPTDLGVIGDAATAAGLLMAGIGEGESLEGGVGILKPPGGVLTCLWQW